MRHKLLALMLGLSLSVSAKAADRMTVGEQQGPLLSETPSHFTEDKGFFAEVNLEVNHIQINEPRDQLGALFAGNADIMTLPVTAATCFNLKPDQCVIVATLDSGLSSSLVVRQEIKTLGDLINKQVIVNECTDEKRAVGGVTADRALRHVLKMNGVNGEHGCVHPSNTGIGVKLYPNTGGSTQRLGAFARNPENAGVMLNEPHASRSLRQVAGAHVLVGPEGFPKVSETAMVVKRDCVENTTCRDRLIRYERAYRKGQAYFIDPKNEVEAKKYLNKRFSAQKMTDEEIDRLYKLTQRIWAPDSRTLAEKVKLTVEFYTMQPATNIERLYVELN